MHLENIEMLTGELAFMVNTGKGGGTKREVGGGRWFWLFFQINQNCPPFVSIDFKNARVQSKSYDN